MNRNILRFICLFSLIVLITTSFNVVAWSMFHRDAQNTGYTSDSGPIMNQIFWDSTADETIPGIFFSSPSFFKGRIYIGSVDGSLLSANAYPDGKPYQFFWRFYAEDSVTSTPLIHDGKVFFGSLDGNIYSIYSCIGLQIARYTTNGPVSSSPVIRDQFLYIGSEDGNLYCFNTNALEHIWDFNTGASIRTSPAIADNLVIFANDLGVIYAIHANNGSYFWSYNTGSSFLSSPVVKDNNIIIGSEGGILYNINVQNGLLNWQYDTGNSIIGTPTVYEDNIVFASLNGHLYCINRTNGVLLWETLLIGSVFGSPIIADKHIYVPSGNQINCLTLIDGELVWFSELDSAITSSPIVVKAHLFVATSNGTIYCFRNHHSPLIPKTPVGLQYGIIGEEYDFIFETTDPENDLIYYQINWGDGKMTGWLGPYNSGEDIMESHRFLQEGNFSITVRAKDQYGYISDWSEPLYFNVHILDITRIRGGVGLRATLENKGVRQLWRIKWNIEYEGGKVINPANDHFSGEILNLPAGESVQIKTGPFFEIGRIRFTISVVDKDDANQHSITIKAFAMGFIIILLPW